jgi:hypothetical protein
MTERALSADPRRLPLTWLDASNTSRVGAVVVSRFGSCLALLFCLQNSREGLKILCYTGACPKASPKLIDVIEGLLRGCNESMQKGTAGLRLPETVVEKQYY